MGRIAEETIRQVLAAADIVQIIGCEVKLRRMGSNYRGLCPFHTEKSPSFYVSPSRNSYHCFGCGAGGTVFTFLMERDRLTFPEAVKRLAEGAGIHIEEDELDPDATSSAKHRSELLNLHRKVADWFHLLLLKHPGAETVRDYLKTRDFGIETAKRWKLGWCPAKAQSLTGWAEEQGFNWQMLQDAGLLLMPDEPDRRPYSRFRNRLMFPICNDMGEVIAFSGRILDADAKAAKYVNSPETRLFQKSRVLFGFDKTRRAILKEKRAIVCEGQFDLIRCFENGIENVIAPLGTAFTSEHAAILRRHTDEVILCYDSDNAGYKAAERTFAILAPAGLHVRVTTLPKGEDPDSLIRQKGTDALRALLSGALGFFDYQLKHREGEFDMESLRDRVRFAGVIAKTIALLNDPIARDQAVLEMSTRLRVQDVEFRKLVGEAQREQAHQARNMTRGQENEFETEVGEEEESNWTQADISPSLALLCKQALTETEVLDWLRKQEHEEILRNVRGAEVISKIIISSVEIEDPFSITNFIMSLPSSQASWLSGLLVKETPEGGLDTAKHAWIEMEIEWLRARHASIQARLRSNLLDTDLMMDLMKENIDLQKELLALLEKKSKVGFRNP